MITEYAALRFPKSAAGALLLTLALAGCTSKQDAALQKAEQQANATGQPQQIVSTDKNGNTTTTTVQPLQPGQTTPAITTTVTPATVLPANTPATVPAPAGTPTTASTPPSDVTTANPAPQSPVLLSDGTTAPAAANQPPNQPTNQSGQPTQPPAKPSAGQPATSAYQANQPPPPPNAPAPPAAVRIPAGTPLVIRINQHISVKHSHVGDRFTGEIEEPVFGRDRTVLIPRGTPVEGVVDAAHRRGHFKGSSILELRLVSLSLNGIRYPLDTQDLTRTKKGKGKRSAAFIGGGAGAGMLIGGIATGGVGLLVGGLAGGGGGALAGGLTGNRDIEIPAESIVRFRLADPLILQAN